jgi:hypothetical protein
MTVPATSVQLHCHHCSTWLGEAREALTFVGMFKDPRERERVPGPRDTYRCKRCGWANVFQAPDTAPRHWREGIDLKGAA